MRYVSLIQDGKITLSDNPTRKITYKADNELVSVATSLIEEGYFFVDEPMGWPPAAILQELQKQDLLQMSFTAITWLGPEQPKTHLVKYGNSDVRLE